MCKQKKKDNKKLTNEEKVLQFLLEKCSKRKDNKAAISPNEIKLIGLSDNEIILSMRTLQADGCLKITQPSNHLNHDEFDRYWEVEFYSKGIYYFENKESELKTEKKDLRRF